MSQIWTFFLVKPARFHPKARSAIQEFPEDVRRELGKAIFDLQKGEKLGMPLSRTMPSIGTGAEELRIKDRSGAYRVFYLARLANEVLIFHAFTKKKDAKDREDRIGPRQKQFTRGLEGVHCVALKARNLNRLAILAMQDAGAFAKHLNRANPRAT